jgi:NAD(P)-dependent dehydrogenase (short-subunit alcohol dehydrogenase family)/acyl carrier protein
VLLSAAEGWVRGLAVDWAAAFAGLPTTRVDLPTYAFDRRRYWLNTSGLNAPADRAIVDDWQYRVVWRPLPDGDGALSGTWLVVVPADGSGDSWAQAAEKAVTRRGAETLRLTVPPDGGRHELARHLGDLPPVTGVLSLLALDEAPAARFPAIPAGLVATVSLVQALGDAGLEAPLWCLTQEALAASPQDTVRGAAQALVWGVGRVAALEHPQRWGGLIDLPDPSDTAADRLAAVLADGTEDQTAVRADAVLTRRLVRDDEQATPARGGERGTPARTWKPTGTVLVTGGTGSIAGHVARWLAWAGAEHLLLVSRRGLAAPGAPELERELTEAGTRVTTAACDITEPGALDGLLSALPPELPLSTVVHLAGHTRLAPLTELEPGDLADTVAAKVAGAVELDKVIDRYAPGAVVFFSSVAGVWGSGVHAAYAAGNAFLDSLAEQRRGRGVPATAIAWGVWGGAKPGDGASVPGGVDVDRLHRQGLPLIDPEAACAALQRALDRDETFLAVADVDWPRFLPVFTSARPSPLFSELTAVRPDAAEEAEPAANRWAALPPAERERALEDLVRAHVAVVLGHAGPEAVAPDRAFKELGFDSLTAVELRDRLNAATGLRLPATLVFDHPTPGAVTGLLREELFPGAEDAADSLVARLDALEAEIAELAAGSEVRERLLERLGRITGSQDRPATAVALDAATDDEMFSFISKEFGISRPGPRR